MYFLNYMSATLFPQVYFHPTDNLSTQSPAYGPKHPYMFSVTLCMYADMRVHVSLFLQGGTDGCRNPLARCGLDLRPAQETPDGPSSDLDRQREGGRRDAKRTGGVD